jgi:hypothetical protein
VRIVIMTGEDGSASLLHEPKASLCLQTILKRNTGLLTQGVSTILRLREVRGKLVRKPSGQPHEIAVNGRDDWIGWFELVEDQVNAVALVNTARIVTLLAADMFCVIEADNRLPLTRFSATVIKQVGGTPYDHYSASTKTATSATVKPASTFV